MGEFLESSEYIFQDLQDQEAIDEKVSKILEEVCTPEI